MPRLETKHLVAIAAVIALLVGGVALAVYLTGPGGGAQSAGTVPVATSPPGSRPAGPGDTSIDTTNPSTPPPTAPTATTPAATPATVGFEVWFVQGETLTPVRRTHPYTQSVGAAAINSLIAGPTAQERAEGYDSAVPPETRLLGLNIKAGLATVDLTQEYESGGGSLSFTLRLGQVVYTLTQFPTVQGVRFHLDGHPIDVIGGEGLVIDQPLTRADYGQYLAPIIVDQPRSGEQVASPIKVSGNANVFEANVTIIVLDAAGHELARTFTTASCGTGCRGTFQKQVAYQLTHSQEGVVVVQDDDADGDGRPSFQVRIPVFLAAS